MKQKIKKLIVELAPGGTDAEIIGIESAILCLKGVVSVSIAMLPERRGTKKIADLLFVPSENQKQNAKKTLKKMGVRIL